MAADSYKKLSILRTLVLLLSLSIMGLMGGTDQLRG
jgi:hypothetical protein